MFLRSEYYRNHNRRNPRKRNITLEEVEHEHPYEYLLFSKEASQEGKPFFVCPVCQRRVTKLFTIAHDRQDAYYKFAIDDAACGYDTSTLISDMGGSRCYFPAVGEKAGE